jgi:hypothetical protein
MDEVFRKHVIKFMDNTSLWFSLVKGYLEGDKDKDQVLRMLKSQHASNQYLLQDMGMDMDERTQQVRSLNQQVRELERKLGSAQGLSFESLCQFVNTMEDKVDAQLKAVGLSGNFRLRVGTALEGVLTVYGHRASAFEFGIKSEAEAAQAASEHEQQIERFKGHFDTEWIVEEHISNSTSMIYTQRNTEALIKLMEETLGVEISSPKYELKLIGGQTVIQDFSFSSIQLQQHRNLQATFSRY